jgi:hypothetical protein
LRRIDLSGEPVVGLLDPIADWELRPHSLSHLANLLRSDNFERLINQRLDALDEADGVWQTGVMIERSLIYPARMDEEQPRVAFGPKRVYAEAARLRARRCQDLQQRFCNGGLAAGARVKASKDEQLHIQSGFRIDSGQTDAVSETASVYE